MWESRRIVGEQKDCGTTWSTVGVEHSQKAWKIVIEQENCGKAQKSVRNCKELRKRESIVEKHREP